MLNGAVPATMAGGAEHRSQKVRRVTPGFLRMDLVCDLRIMLFLPELWSRPFSRCMPYFSYSSDQDAMDPSSRKTRGRRFSGPRGANRIIVDHDNKSSQHPLWPRLCGRLGRDGETAQRLGSSMSNRRLKGSRRAAPPPGGRDRTKLPGSTSASSTDISAISSGGCRSGYFRISSARWPRSTSGRRSIRCWS